MRTAMAKHPDDRNSLRHCDARHLVDANPFPRASTERTVRHMSAGEDTTSVEYAFVYQPVDPVAPSEASGVLDIVETSPARRGLARWVLSVLLLFVAGSAVVVTGTMLMDRLRRRTVLGTTTSVATTPPAAEVSDAPSPPVQPSWPPPSAPAAETLAPPPDPDTTYLAALDRAGFPPVRTPRSGSPPAT